MHLVLNVTTNKEQKSPDNTPRTHKQGKNTLESNIKIPTGIYNMKDMQNIDDGFQGL